MRISGMTSVVLMAWSRERVSVASMAPCSCSMLSQSKPWWASHSAASGLPSPSQVPMAGLPSLSKRLTVFGRTDPSLRLESYLPFPAQPLQVIGRESGRARDTREHPRADLIAVVEGEDDVRPTRTLQHAMRSSHPLDRPANPQQRREDSTCARGRPSAHAAWNKALNSGTASPCS